MKDFLKHLSLGAAYYPEHWPKTLWEDDLRRMKEHGLTMLRIGDFVWSKYEAQENVFTIGYYDEFLDLCEKYDMQVVFCTPTAAPPLWAGQHYPEILNCDRHGHPYYGDRRFYNYNSEKYQFLCCRLVEKLAEHYGNRKCIVGWQIDNEFNCELDEYYSEADHIAFRKYLKDKFKTLDCVNESLGLTFWNRYYSDWDQVRLPAPGISDTASPHLMLEKKRFISASTLKFAKLQADILRKYIGDRFITTNGLFSNVDYDAMIDQSIDFISYDCYPDFAFRLDGNPVNPEDFNDRCSGQALMRTRAISKVFGIMEQQSGPGGWTTSMEMPMPRPGQMRLWTYQSLAHGANFINYFRWRTSPIGPEIYWHGLNDYANTDNRRLHELKQIAAEFAHLEPLADTRYVAKVAILKDYSNMWDASVDIWHGRLEVTSEGNLFKALQSTHTPCDYLYLNGNTTLENLKAYEMLIYPHAAIMTEETAKLLESYVQTGGKLVFGTRTGYKDAFGRCPMRPMPGLVDALCGIQVEEYTLCNPSEAEMTATWDGQTHSAPQFNEVLKPVASDVEVLATYDHGYYAGKPALCRRKYGSGTVLYWGACFDVSGTEHILKAEGVADPNASIVSVPETVELAVRGNGATQYLFLLNYKPTETSVQLNAPLFNVLTQENQVGQVVLPPFGVLVYKM